MNQECGPAIYSGFEQLNALLGGHPALHHNVVQFLAEKFVHHPFVRPAHLQEVRQCTYGRQSLPERARLQQSTHRIGGVAMIANQRLQRIASSGHCGLLVTQPVCIRA